MNDEALQPLQDAIARKDKEAIKKNYKVAVEYYRELQHKVFFVRELKKSARQVLKQ